MRRILIGMAALFLLLVGGFGFTLWSNQGKMIFPGPSIDIADLVARAERAKAEQFTIETEDGETLSGWRESHGGRGAVLYFHGNASVCDRGDAFRDMLAETGADLLCVAYRGYPGSSGSASEAGLRKDARALWKHAVASYPAEHIVLHGRSLGGGVAIGLAAEVEAGGLVVESSFRSIRLLAGRTYPLFVVDLLLAHPFDSEARTPKVTEPSLVLHGDEDTTIPVDHGRWLGRNLTGHYLEVPGHGHNSGLLTKAPSARAAWTAFVSAHMAPAREPLP